MKACRSVWGVMVLAIPARRAIWRTTRPAPCRSSRRPSLADLAVLAGHRQRPVAALEAQVLDVGAGSFRYPQPVQREQRDQRMHRWRPETSGDEERAELVAVQRSRVRLVIDPRTADVRGRQRSKSSSSTAYL